MAATEQDKPRILALETSGRVGSVALGIGAQLVVEHAFTQGMRHAVELLPTVRDLCAQVEWRPEDIEHVYVSIGPGSFTGVRIAVAVARSLALAHGCPLVAVPTLDVIAENAPKSLLNIVVMLDAKRGQVFAARYARGATGDELTCVDAAQLVDPADFMKLALAAGPAAVLGEGVEYHRAAVTLAGVTEVAKERWPARAAALHKLGWQKALRAEFTPMEELLPRYIRMAEAEEVWRKKHA